jgi:dipeptide/tripeptide permease
MIYSLKQRIDFMFREFTFLGLFLIALGTGGIKPCVSAFGGMNNTITGTSNDTKQTGLIAFYLR